MQTISRHMQVTEQIIYVNCKQQRDKIPPCLTPQSTSNVGLMTPFQNTEACNLQYQFSNKRIWTREETTWNKCTFRIQKNININCHLQGVRAYCVGHITGCSACSCLFCLKNIYEFFKRYKTYLHITTSLAFM